MLSRSVNAVVVTSESYEQIIQQCKIADKTPRFILNVLQESRADKRVSNVFGEDELGASFEYYDEVPC